MCKKKTDSPKSRSCEVRSVSGKSGGNRRQCGSFALGGATATETETDNERASKEHGYGASFGDRGQDGVGDGELCESPVEAVRLERCSGQGGEAGRTCGSAETSAQGEKVFFVDKRCTNIRCNVNTPDDKSIGVSRIQHKVRGGEIIMISRTESRDVYRSMAPQRRTGGLVGACVPLCKVGIENGVTGHWIIRRREPPCHGI